MSKKNKVVILNNEADQDMDEKLSMLDYIASLKDGTAKEYNGYNDFMTESIDNKIISNVNSIIEDRNKEINKENYIDDLVYRPQNNYYKPKEVSINNYDDPNYVLNRFGHATAIEPDFNRFGHDTRIEPEEHDDTKKYRNVTESLFGSDHEDKVVETKYDEDVNSDNKQEEFKTNDEEDITSYNNHQDYLEQPLEYGVTMEKLPNGDYVLSESNPMIPPVDEKISSIVLKSDYIKKNLPKNQFVDKDQYETFIVDSIEYIVMNLNPTMILPADRVYSNETHYGRVKECNYSGYNFYDIGNNIVEAYRLTDKFYSTFEELSNDETVNLLYLFTKLINEYNSEDHYGEMRSTRDQYMNFFTNQRYAGLYDKFTKDFINYSEAQFVPSDYVDPEIDGVDVIAADEESRINMRGNMDNWAQMLNAVPSEEVVQASAMNNYLNNRVEKPTVEKDNVEVEPVEHKITTEWERNLFDSKPKVQEEIKEKVIPSTPVAEKETDDSDSLLPEDGSFVDTESDSNIVHIAKDEPKDDSEDIIIPTIRKR